MKFSKRTDLALESANSVDTESGLPEGIEVRSEESDCFTITSVNIKNADAAEKIGKPKGRYITLETGSRLDIRPQNFAESAHELAAHIKSLIGSPKSVLVVGLGNSEVTPDSLGPRVSSHIFATRHIRENAPEIDTNGLGDVSVITPGVMGQTGIEASELVKNVCGSLMPSAIIAVDALACSELSHLGKTIQLTDTGISPGSGVLNSRKELSRQTLGATCIAIGVPTIADIGEDGEEPMMVTPRTIDKLTGCSAQLIAAGINLALHTGLDLDEIISLTS